MYIQKQNTQGMPIQNISTGMGIFWEDIPIIFFHIFKKCVLCKAL